MCGTSNPQSPASRAVAAFHRRADPLAAVFQLRRLCEHRSIPAEAGSSVVPPTVSESAPARPHRTSSPAPSPAAQVSRGHFVVGVVFGLLGSGGETLTAGWPIVSWPVPSLQSGWLWHSWSLYRSTDMHWALGSRARQGDAPPTIAYCSIRILSGLSRICDTRNRSNFLDFGAHIPIPFLDSISGVHLVVHLMCGRLRGGGDTRHFLGTLSAPHDENSAPRKLCGKRAGRTPAWSLAITQQ